MSSPRPTAMKSTSTLGLKSYWNQGPGHSSTSGPACRRPVRESFGLGFQFLKFSRPRTTPSLVDGLDALCFLPLSAFGLRISLFDFFWPLAIVLLPARAAPRAPLD